MIGAAFGEVLGDSRAQNEFFLREMEKVSSANGRVPVAFGAWSNRPRNGVDVSWLLLSRLISVVSFSFAFEGLLRSLEWAFQFVVAVALDHHSIIVFCILPVAPLTGVDVSLFSTV